MKTDNKSMSAEQKHRHKHTFFDSSTVYVPVATVCSVIDKFKVPDGPPWPQALFYHITAKNKTKKKQTAFMSFTRDP